MDFEFLEPSVSGYRVRIGINLQMWLGLYVEPVQGEPGTYEDEDRVYTFDDQQLVNLIGIASEKVIELFEGVLNMQALARLGATYELIDQITKTPRKAISDRKYDADEDLSFLFYALSTVHGFISEANAAREKE